MIDSLSVRKLYENLEYWIFIGIGDDIIYMPNQRLEYQHLVNKYKVLGDDLEILKLVMHDLKDELALPWYKRPTFRVLLKLKIKRILHMI